LLFKEFDNCKFVCHVLILICYGTMDFEDVKQFNPSLVFPNEKNNLLN